MQHATVVYSFHLCVNTHRANQLLTYNSDIDCGPLFSFIWKDIGGYMSPIWIQIRAEIKRRPNFDYNYWGALGRYFYQV